MSDEPRRSSFIGHRSLLIPPPHQLDESLRRVHALRVEPAESGHTILLQIALRLAHVGAGVERVERSIEGLAVAREQFAGEQQAVVERNGFAQVGDGQFREFF